MNDWWGQVQRQGSANSGVRFRVGMTPIRVPKPHLRVPESVFCKVHTFGSPGPPCRIDLFPSKGTFGFSSRKTILQNETTVTTTE